MIDEALDSSPSSPIEINPIELMSLEEKALLKEACKDSSGHIIKTRISAGLIIQTNGKNLVEGRNPRSEAKWSSALEGLCNLNYVSSIGYKGESFKVTHKGFEIGDLIPE